MPELPPQRKGAARLGRIYRVRKEKGVPITGRAKHFKKRTRAAAEAKKLTKKIDPTFFRVIALNPKVMISRLAEFFGVDYRIAGNYRRVVTELKRSGNVREAIRRSGLTPETVVEIQKILSRPFTAKQKRKAERFAKFAQEVKRLAREERKKVEEKKRKARKKAGGKKT